MTQTATVLLSNLSQVHNRFPPVNKLPPEVLAMVFKHLMLRQEPRDIVNPPDRITWPVVSRVCGYWRRTALYTPELWTVIQTPEHGTRGASSCREFALLSLTRSGSLPLSVHHSDGDGDASETIKWEDILPFLPRVQDLSLNCTTLDHMGLLSSPAPMLQTFAAYVSDANRGLDLFGGWQTPRLETLFMFGSSAWQRLSIRHLRRLVIADQTFHPPTIESLFHILSLNTRLEDLVLREIFCKIDELEEMREALAKMAPVGFSSLRRICIFDSNVSEYPVLTTALNLKIITTSDSWYRYFNLSYVISTVPTLPAGAILQQDVISPQTLACLDYMIIASDGHRCLHFDVHPQYGVNPLDVVRATIQPSEVRELWLSTKDRRAAPFLQDMHQVTTLVFPEIGTSAVAVWLGEINERKLFPKLEEVRVWTRTDQNGSGSPLLGFLKRRQRIGQGIHTLRFLKHPDTPVNIHCTFDGWKAGPWKFERVADHVIFEEPKERPRMELPEVCDLPWALEKDVYPFPMAGG